MLCYLNGLTFRNERGTSHPSSKSSDVQQQKRNHFESKPDIKIEGSNSKTSGPELVRKEPSKTSIAIKLPTAGAGRSIGGGGYKPPTSKSNHKSSVSILPVNSVDSQLAPSTTVKKQVNFKNVGSIQ